MTLDPVCNTCVDEREAQSAGYEDELYFFCSEICKRVFEDDPELFSGDEFNSRRFTYSLAGEVTLSR